MLNSDLILRATKSESFSECCQSRITRQPARLNSRVVARSRSAFREILCCQYRRLSWGIRQCHRQPCQKQPSTNTAIFCLRKTKSGFPITLCLRRQPVMPRDLNIAISFNSVSLFPVDLIAAITCERLTLLNTSAIPLYVAPLTKPTVL